MSLKLLLKLLYLSVFLITIISTCTSAIVDVGIHGVTVSDLSPDYPTDHSPEPGEEFEVNVKVKNYGDEATEGTIEIYLDDEKKDSWGEFPIKPNEIYSHQFMISHNDCGTYNINVKIIMNNNTPDHELEVSIPVKIGKEFHVTITPEKILIGRPIQVDIKNDLGINVENARIGVGSMSGIAYKGAVTRKNEIFSFTPANTGYFLITVTKEEEGYCEYIKKIEARHNLTVYGPYPDNPIVGDEIVIRVYDEENEPVHGASINVRGPENITLNTDRAGGVLFVVKKAGEYQIGIEKSTPLYWEVNKTIYVLAKPQLLINVSPEKPLLGDDVTVKIINENVSNANITITNPEGFERTLTTDENNEITFDVKLLGKYIILAEKEEYTAVTTKIDVYNSLKILIEPENPVMGDNVTITVLDQEKYPVPNAVVSIKGKEEFNKTTDHNGEIKFKLESTNYKIFAEKKDHINATAAITPIVNKLLLNLSSKKLKIDKGDIHVSVTEKATGILTSAKITVEGERTGFKVEKTASEFAFTPEFADTYKVLVTKDNYFGAEDVFIIEPAPIDINAILNKKEITIKITSYEKDLSGAEVLVRTPKSKMITKTNEEGIVHIDIDEEGEGNYLIHANKTPNYKRAEIRVDIIKNQEYWWLWLILIIILITGIMVWKF